MRLINQRLTLLAKTQRGIFGSIFVRIVTLFMPGPVGTTRIVMSSRSVRMHPCFTGGTRTSRHVVAPLGGVVAATRKPSLQNKESRRCKCNE